MSANDEKVRENPIGLASPIRNILLEDLAAEDLRGDLPDKETWVVTQAPLTAIFAYKSTIEAQSPTEIMVAILDAESREWPNNDPYNSLLGKTFRRCGCLAKGRQDNCSHVAKVRMTLFPSPDEDPHGCFRFELVRVGEKRLPTPRSSSTTKAARA